MLHVSDMLCGSVSSSCSASEPERGMMGGRWLKLQSITVWACSDQFRAKGHNQHQPPGHFPWPKSFRFFEVCPNFPAKAHIAISSDHKRPQSRSWKTIRSDELIQFMVSTFKSFFAATFHLEILFDPAWSYIHIYIYMWSKMIQVYIINAFVDNVHLLIVPSVLQN